MKHLLTLLSFSLFMFSALHAQTPGRAFPPEYIGSRPGTINLSNGFYWGEVEATPASESLAAFLEEQGIAVNRHSRSGKNILMRIRAVESIPFVPKESRNGYSIRIESGRIVIEYLSIQGLFLGCRQLEEFILRESFSRGAVRKKRSLPCYEIRGWMNENDLTVFRQETPETAIPLYATTVQVMLTDPAKGWLPATNALKKVGYTEPLYTGKSSTYTELETEWNRLIENGFEVIPVFRLDGSNERFEQVTGHPMLSVEGMRFVRFLLNDFFRQTSFPVAGFIVPEGRYRKQIEELVSRYPHVTDLRFFDE